MLKPYLCIQQTIKKSAEAHHLYPQIYSIQDPDGLLLSLISNEMTPTQEEDKNYCAHTISS